MKDNKDKLLKKDDEGNALPIYPAGEDIYKINKKTDVENSLKNKNPDTGNNEKEFEEDMSGDDLDIPGAELDDEAEAIGSEDEENNYYSIGGDDHNDLDEDKGA